VTDLLAPDRIDAETRVIALATQHPVGMIGVPRAGVRLSWRVESTSAARQLGAQVRRRDGGSDWVEADVELGENSLGVLAPGGELPAGRVREFAVRVATESGWSDWSETLAVEAAVDRLDAVVISVAATTEGASPYLRRIVTLRSQPATARLRVTSLGLHEFRINGEKVGDEHLAPGWTAYQERIVVATHDVAAHLVAGDNALGAILADGWYRGRLAWKGKREHYGSHLGLIAQLEVEYDDGSTETFSTDESWRASTGSILMSSIYDGSDLDLALEPQGWDSPGFDDATWAAVEVLDVDHSIFRPRIAAPVRTVAEFHGELVARENGRTRIDLTQNISGWVRLRVRGSAGDTVTIRHAEVLEGDGALHTAALRSARATDTYVLDRDGEHVLEPAFTFHGFQFAEVEGAEVIEATGVAISSDTPARGRFSSGLSALDRLHENVVWSQRDNFVSVPTDCPQRDERLGWTGDAQAFSFTANTLFDSESFWRSWLIDLEIDQPESGAVAAVVPNIIVDTDFDPTGQASIMGRAGWADAATIVPWSTYESYGSLEVLERQLSSMRRWVDHLERRAAGEGDVLLPTEFQFGDWLDPDAPGDKPHEAKTSGDYVANAFYSFSARLLSRSERLVGDAARAQAAEELADRVAAATWERYGDHAVTTQTGCALAIELAIAPAEQHAHLGEQLAGLVRADRGRISTGFLGTPYVLPALSRTGHLDEAFLMLLRRDAPSWLYEVDRGATTIWERWDAILPDGSINPGDMAQGDTMISFNHYAYGAVIDWVYRTVAGIAPDAERPGYRLIRVAPRPAVGIDHASAAVETGLGAVAIDWRLDGDALEISLTVPFGADAVLDLPLTGGSGIEINGAVGANGQSLAAGSHRIRVTEPAIADPARALAATGTEQR
jgi:alpha-L-rhamnosidase